MSLSVGALPARLLLVVEPAQARPELLRPLVDAGLRWLWLRAKALSGDEVEALLARLLPSLGQARLSLGGHPTLAARHGLACHLPRDGDVAAAAALRLPLLGYSAHDVAEARAAFAAGADYVSLSPIFPPSSKPLHGSALGLAGLASAAASLARPVLALGGVTAALTLPCLAAGALGVAVAGGILGAPSPLKALDHYLTATTPVRGGPLPPPHS